MTKTTLTALALALAFGACANDTAPETDTTAVMEGDEVYENDEGEDDDDEDSEARSVDPPAAVAEAFAAAYPAATDVSWSMEGADYEAEAMIGGVETSILYTASGVAGAVETEIPVADLPAAVTAALARDYIDAVVTEAARIVDNGQTTYEAEITVNGTLTDIIYQQDGTLVETILAEND